MGVNSLPGRAASQPITGSETISKRLCTKSPLPEGEGEGVPPFPQKGYKTEGATGR